MRVLWWVHSYWPMIGGVEVIGDELARGLRERGHEIEVIAHQDPGLPENGEFHAFPIHRFPFFDALASRDPDRILDVRGRIEALYDRLRPELVHLHTLSYASWFCARSLVRRSIPLLVTRHGFTDEESVAPQTLRDDILRRAAWVGCCSNAVREATVRAVPDIADRTSVVLNGLAPPADAPTPIPAGPPRLLCIGRAIDQKGFDLAIEAMADILSHFPETRLRIVGQGPAIDALRQHAQRLGMDAAVEFPGWIEPVSVPAEMSAATAVVVPSRGGEGFGLVALQAAQMARPVVTTRVGGLPEVVLDGFTGLVVDPEDPAALARAVTSLLADRETAERLGQAARTRAQTVFGRDRFREAYDDLYRRTQRKALEGPAS